MAARAWERPLFFSIKRSALKTRGTEGLTLEMDSSKETNSARHAVGLFGAKSVLSARTDFEWRTKKWFDRLFF